MSTYFQKLLDNKIIDGRKKEIILGNLDGERLKELVSFAYTSKLDVNDENVKELMDIAVTFELDLLRKKCAKYINISFDNCVDWFTFAGENNLKELRRDALQMIGKNFMRIPLKAIQALDYSDFKEVLENEENVDTEECMLERLTKWIEYDEAERMKHALDLLKCIQSKEISKKTHQQPKIASSSGGKLMIIKESELRRGDLIGEGAFGKVSKGIWKPENGVCQYSVAIKALKNVNPRHEAYTPITVGSYMPWLNHPNLLKIYGVCMAREMMLITPLMPLGSLRDYVVRESTKISSKTLLSWATQIADGMAYLESKCVVHGNLGTRNVLLCTPLTVKISDCGLSNLIAGSNENKSVQTRVTWMASECIESNIFTTKSDVYAFGMTIWELLTLASLPNQYIKDEDIVVKMESGCMEFDQPEGCSFALYVTLQLCGSSVPCVRPTFKKLADEFRKYSMDPAFHLAPYAFGYALRCPKK